MHEHTHTQRKPLREGSGLYISRIITDAENLCLSLICILVGSKLLINQEIVGDIKTEIRDTRGTSFTCLCECQQHTVLERAETNPVLSCTRAPTTPVPKVGHGAASRLLKEASEAVHGGALDFRGINSMVHFNLCPRIELED